MGGRQPLVGVDKFEAHPAVREGCHPSPKWGGPISSFDLKSGGVYRAQDTRLSGLRGERPLLLLLLLWICP